MTNTTSNSILSISAIAIFCFFAVATSESKTSVERLAEKYEIETEDVKECKELFRGEKNQQAAMKIVGQEDGFLGMFQTTCSDLKENSKSFDSEDDFFLARANDIENQQDLNYFKRKNEEYAEKERLIKAEKARLAEQKEREAYIANSTCIVIGEKEICEPNNYKNPKVFERVKPSCPPAYNSPSLRYLCPKSYAPWEKSNLFDKDGNCVYYTSSDLSAYEKESLSSRIMNASLELALQCKSEDLSILVYQFSSNPISPKFWYSQNTSGSWRYAPENTIGTVGAFDASDRVFTYYFEGRGGSGSMKALQGFQALEKTDASYKIGSLRIDRRNGSLNSNKNLTSYDSEQIYQSMGVTNSYKCSAMDEGSAKNALINGFAGEIDINVKESIKRAEKILAAKAKREALENSEPVL